jgi:DNA repair protein NreA
MNISWIKTKGRTFDPIQLKVAAQKSYNQTAKQDYAGKAPNIFVGRYGYPHVNVGILNTEHYTTHDNPLHWSKHNTQIPEIIKLRTQLVNSSFKASIKNFNNKFLEMSQEIAQAHKPTEVEINLDKKPQFRIQFKRETKPHGPRVNLKRATITENPTIKRHIDKAVSDTDLKASSAMSYLYNKGYDEHAIIKLLTVGNLGIKPQRKLVPTRWGITATHSTIGNTLVKEIKDYIHYNYVAYFGSYIGNYYLILMFPEIWQYELFETIIIEDAPFSTDFEPYTGRKKYAEETAGGFYTVRMACLEELKRKKRQASVLALRFINPNEYIAPLGVWVTLEATRKAMQNPPLVFGSKELLLNYAQLFIKKKFNYDLDTILRKSVILENIKSQSKLAAFF